MTFNEYRIRRDLDAYEHTAAEKIWNELISGGHSEFAVERMLDDIIATVADRHYEAGKRAGMKSRGWR